MRLLLLFVVLTALVGCTTKVTRVVADAQNLKPGKVLVLEPDIELSLLKASGLTEVRADWTIEAQRLYDEALTDYFARANLPWVRDQRDPEADPSSREEQVRKLHGAVAVMAFVHQTGPTTLAKTRNGGFDWTVGPGVATLAERYEADYALYTYIRDSYSSAGRAAVIVVGALLGVSASGGNQFGVATLVDLRTGKLVWMNVLSDQSGDLRTAEGAAEATTKLLNNFPFGS